MNIVGGAVGSLCEAYLDAVMSTPSGQRVNLLLEHRMGTVAVERLPVGVGVRVTVNSCGALWVRIPPWAAHIDVSVKSLEGRWRLDGDYVFMYEPPVGQPVSVRYPEEKSEIFLRPRTRDICIRLSGDWVTAIQNFGMDQTLFDPVK